jgi:hypothetical protein
MVVVEVEIPRGLTDGERELLQRFEGLRSESSPDTNPAP